MRYGISKWNKILVFSVFLFNFDAAHKQWNNIVHDESGKDLLINKLTLAAVKENQSKIVFEASEGDFYAPSGVIQLFYYTAWISLMRKIGDQILVFVFTDVDSDDPEIYLEYTRFVIAWQKVEDPLWVQILENNGILPLAGMFARQNECVINIGLARIREMESGQQIRRLWRVLASDQKKLACINDVG